MQLYFKYVYTGCLKRRPLRIFRKDFPKLFYKFENIFISTSFEKEISILVIWQKSYRPGNFHKTTCPKKHLDLKRSDILILSLQLKNCIIQGQNSRNCSPKISPIIIFFYIFLASISHFADIDGPVTFFLYDLECSFIFQITWIFNYLQNSKTVL